MKLLLDEMWTPAIAEQLRRLGHDVQAVAERRDLLGKADVELMAIAVQEERAIVTENIDDFRTLARRMRRGEQTHAGLIYTTRQRFYRSHAGVVGRMVRALDVLLRAELSQWNLEHWLQDPDDH